MEQPEQIAQLQALVRDTLVHAVEARSRGLWSDQGVARTLCSVCDRARHTGLRAEQLLVVLKETWRRLPEARRLRRDERDATIARAVTLCIREFYRGQRADAAPGVCDDAPRAAPVPTTPDDLRPRASTVTQGRHRAHDRESR